MGTLGTRASPGVCGLSAALTIASEGRMDLGAWRVEGQLRACLFSGLRSGKNQRMRGKGFPGPLPGPGSQPLGSWHLSAWTCEVSSRRAWGPEGPVCGEVRAFERSQPDSGGPEVFLPILQGARVPCVACVISPAFLC